MRVVGEFHSQPELRRAIGLNHATGKVLSTGSGVTVQFDDPVPVVEGLPLRAFTHDPRCFEHHINGDDDSDDSV